MTDLTPNDALCPQGEHAPGPEPPSPAAQAIVAAFNDRYELLGPLESNWQEVCLAAALRALADVVVPLYTCGTTATRAQTRLGIRHKILSIATELESTDD